MKSLLPLTALSILLLGSSISNAQCVINPSNVYAFTYNGTDYELVRENKTWTEAASCAVISGGHLAEINDQAEQDAVYNEIITNGGITASNTVAPDGGGASYVWIGGNDLGTEGEWIWDGANTGSGTQFWQGTSSGSPIGGLYNNWGNEPDDFNGQDGLGLAITDWPLGVTSQWNDVDDGNSLYYLIEYPNTTGTIVICYLSNDLAVYPNPVQDQLHVLNESEGEPFSQFTIIDATGKIVKSINASTEMEQTIDVSTLNQGVYFINIDFTNGTSVQKKFVK
ncbi:MAG: hypothetical protein ACJASQ_002256 [Crocinitomicaceae bacterium]|jgi:hypothetical protein